MHQILDQVIVFSSRCPSHISCCRGFDNMCTNTVSLHRNINVFQEHPSSVRQHWEWKMLWRFLLNSSGVCCAGHCVAASPLDGLWTLMELWDNWECNGKSISRPWQALKHFSEYSSPLLWSFLDSHPDCEPQRCWLTLES